MFKVLISIILLVALSAAGSHKDVQTCLEEDLKGFIALLPEEKLHHILEKHLNNDPGFQAAISYFKSAEWATLINNLRSTPEYINLKTYLNTLGLNVDKTMSFLDKNIKKMQVKIKVSKGTKPDLRAFIMELEQELPVAKMLGYLGKNVMGKAYFKDLYDQLSGKEGRELIGKVLVLPEFTRIVEVLDGMGLQVSQLVLPLKAFLGVQ